ncbi:MAG: hypothetical protein M3Y66_03425 [Actinomycetota bacterium]|nr:hypothetical protein [Actinomycetota bacterium]
MSEEERHRPRRPAMFNPSAMETFARSLDPLRQIEAAHESAAILVHTGRTARDPELTARLVALVEELGLSTVADLWAARPARSLPGCLWRLYVLREWVRRDPGGASADYLAGMRFTDVNHAVAGVAEPPGPDELAAMTDAVLAGVFAGDLAVALDRAAAFCRVVSAGRADLSEGEEAAQRAAQLLTTAADLAGAANLWREGELL